MHDGVMSTKAQLFAALGIALLAGLATLTLGLRQGETPGTLLVAMGGLVVVMSCDGLVATHRWLRPSTRLPEALRNVVPARSWRQSPMTLELRDGQRITFVAVRPGGYVVARRTDPDFDAREVVSVVPSTEGDRLTEVARQARDGRP